MTSGITYCTVAGTLPEIEALAAEARSEGFQHIDRRLGSRRPHPTASNGSAVRLPRHNH